MTRVFLIAIFLLSLTACMPTATITKVDLKYSPTAPIQPAPANTTIRVGSFIDSRGEAPTWIGTIRGGFGNHLKDLETNEPLARVVEQAFNDALEARGVDINSPNPSFQLSGNIKALIGDQVAKREANVGVDISVTDISSGQIRFSQSYTTKIIDGSALSMKTGIFASVEDLRVIIEKALKETVDKALEDKSFRAALQI